MEDGFRRKPSSLLQRPEIGKPIVKRQIAMAGLAVWMLSLFVGIGFAVAGEVTGTNDLPYENQLLR